MNSKTGYGGILEEPFNLQSTSLHQRAKQKGLHTSGSFLWALPSWRGTLKAHGGAQAPSTPPFHK